MDSAAGVSLLVAVPCFGAQMHSYTASSLFSLGALLQEQGIPHGIITPSGESFIPATRNHIAATFLDYGYSHLMCIDADIQFAPQSVLDLLAMAVDFAAAHYRLKQPQRVVHCSNPCAQTTDDPVTRVASVGAGFCLIARAVFLRLNPETPLVHGPDYNTLIHDYYSPYYDAEHQLLIHEDVAMCNRWRGIGGEIWLNRDIRLGHWGGMGYA